PAGEGATGVGLDGQRDGGAGAVDAVALARAADDLVGRGDVAAADHGHGQGVDLDVGGRVLRADRVAELAGARRGAGPVGAERLVGDRVVGAGVLVVLVAAHDRV